MSRRFAIVNAINSAINFATAEFSYTSRYIMEDRKPDQPDHFNRPVIDANMEDGILNEV